MQIGGLGGVISNEVNTTEIEAVARVYDTPVTPDLLRRIRTLDDAYRQESMKRLNKGSGK